MQQFLIIFLFLGTSTIGTMASTETAGAPFYNCTSKTPGMHTHPFDCTRYMLCLDGVAYERDCEICDKGAEEDCPRGRKQFNTVLKMCDWPSRAGCFVDDGSTTPIPDLPTTVSHEDPRCPVNCEYQAVPCECGVFFQCRDGIYSEYQCSGGLHFNNVTLQCDDAASAGCDLDPSECCECKYIPEGACSPNYVFQDHDRNATSYEGKDHCIQYPRSCQHGLVWNAGANGADGACDLRGNVAACWESGTSDATTTEAY